MTARQKRLKLALRLSDLTKAQRAKLEAFSRTWQRIVAPMKEAVRRSERITAKDLSVIINARVTR